MIASLRQALARALATLVTVLTLGKVEVNPTGRPMTSPGGRDDSEIAVVDDPPGPAPES